MIKKIEQFPFAEPNIALIQLRKDIERQREALRAPFENSWFDQDKFDEIFKNMEGVS